MGRIGTAAVVAVVALGAAACGSTTSLDMGKLEGAITDKTRELFPGRQVSGAACPSSDEVEVERGGRFSCTVRIDGVVATYDVTQDDDEGNVTFALATAVLDLAKAEAEAAAGIAEQTGIDATVDCGADPLLAIEPGGTFECQATEPGGSAATVTFTVEDVEGNLTWELTG